jgi:voltage-gated potassium channel
MAKKKNIILFGFGNFGKQLYKNLLAANYNIKVVSSNENYVENARENNIDMLSVNIKKNDDIKSININQDEDLLYCAMTKTANNLFLVLSLRALYPRANIIAVSNSFENTRKLKYAGVNSVIDLYETTSRRVVNMLTKPAVTKAIDEIIYKQNSLKIAEITLPPNSMFDGELLADVEFKALGIILIAIIDRELGHELIFIDHHVDHKLDAGDVLVVMGHDEKIKMFQDRVNSKT